MPDARFPFPDDRLPRGDRTESHEPSPGPQRSGWRTGPAAGAPTGVDGTGE